MTGASIRASVIICTRDRAAALARILEDLGHQDVPAEVGWEVLVIDNGSRDRTRTVVEEAKPRHPGEVRYLAEPRPGKSFALNTGVAAARGDVLVFTDDDVQVDPQWLREMLQPFTDPQCQGVGGRLLPVFSQGPPLWLTPDIPFPYRFDLGDKPLALDGSPFGANMAFRREAFTRHGGFRTDLGPRPGDPLGGEDSEFGNRLQMAGARLLYAPRAVVHHPVTEAQASTAFLRRWHYHYGRALARRTPANPGTPTWGGVPRYLFRELLTSGLGATLYAGPGRLSAQLRLQRAWGQIVETRRRARPGSSDPPGARHGEGKSLK